MSIIRVEAFIDIETEDPEETCEKLNEGLENALCRFPTSHGEIISANVNRYHMLSAAEVEEFGYEPK
jgi:hypothetical protein